MGKLLDLDWYRARRKGELVKADVVRKAQAQAEVVRYWTAK